MRQKSDSCFSQCSSRTQSLWHKGYPPTKYGSNLIKFNEIQIRNAQNKFITSSATYLQDSYLYSDGKYINVENLILKQYAMAGRKWLCLSTNYDSIDLSQKSNQVNELYDQLKKYMVQEDFYKNYKIEKIIGKGSFAKVYKVTQLKEGYGQFAAKVFNKKKMEKNREENEISLWKEVGIMRLISHPQIIKLYEVFEDEKKVYLVLDCLEGGDLLTNISSQVKIYDEQFVLKLMQNLLSALSYIKPDNLILRNKHDISDIVLVDFGLADYYCESGDYLFTNCGSIGYVAPEILRNQQYDFKVDIFSTGIIMFFLITGEQAFQGESTKQIFQNNSKCNIDFNLLQHCQVSQEAKDLCKQLLMDDPFKRPSAEKALQHQWFAIERMKIRKNTLKINKRPTIIRGQNEFIRSNSPLWINKSSIRSISNSSEDIQLIYVNGKDLMIDEIVNPTFNSLKYNSQYDLEDDYIDEKEKPSHQVITHQLLVKQRSLS